MSYLCGHVKLLNAKEREYQGRKYFTCQSLGDDKEVYTFFANWEDQPKQGDEYQMFVESGQGTKAVVRFQKVK